MHFSSARSVFLPELLGPGGFGVSFAVAELMTVPMLRTEGLTWAFAFVQRALWVS